MVFKFLKASYNALKSALKKSRSFFTQRLTTLFATKIDEELIDGLEELFFEADLGLECAQELTEKTKKFLRNNKSAPLSEIIAFLKEELTAQLVLTGTEIKKAIGTPTIILVVGVNGNGKTTSIAKLARLLKEEGNRVLLAGADTFRAGAQEQLAIWAKRLDVDSVAASYKSDPAAVAFDAISKALAKTYDYVLIDTAGRLENKTHLMKELEKIRRSCQKLLPEAPHETLLVMDATIGQNGLMQAKAFHEATPLTGIILTKLDGTAKGGTAFGIQRALRIPIKFISTGETVEDFAPFDPYAFVEALLSSDTET